jgi:choline dehydrogenase-like flavoprotein
VTIIDANDLEDGAALASTVCIIGGGPAGLAVAMRLDELGVDSLVMESGGMQEEPATQALADGRSDGYFELIYARQRRLGGTTNHYGGQTRPLDPVDLDPQSWHGDARWPIGHDQLVAEVPASLEFLGMLDDRWSPSDWFEQPTSFDDPFLQLEVFQAVPQPVQELHLGVLERSTRITVVLHANVTQIRLGSGGRSVSSLDLATLGGSKLEATADHYVIASGGIESPRLLLASSAEVPGGVGNSSGLVGKYFSDHPIIGPIPIVPGQSADITQTRFVANPATGKDVRVFSAISPTPEAQRSLALPGFHAVLLPDPAWSGDEETQGIDALLSLGSSEQRTPMALWIGTEQVPNESNQVTLSDVDDPFGHAQAAVRWGLSDEDEATFERAVELVGILLARSGVGRLRMRPEGERWADRAIGQYHHMGTLRMSSSASAGVVDESFRFHDVGNLWAAGSAVFPTYGHTNPTLNLVALSRLLATRLRDEIAR